MLVSDIPVLAGDKKLGELCVVSTQAIVPLEADQEDLLEILHHRLVERRREELVQDISEAQAEYEAGGCELRSAGELMDEILK